MCIHDINCVFNTYENKLSYNWKHKDTFFSIKIKFSPPAQKYCQPILCFLFFYFFTFHSFFVWNQIHDPSEDWLDPRIAAVNLLQMLARYRQKDTLPLLIPFILGKSN